MTSSFLGKAIFVVMAAAMILACTACAGQQSVVDEPGELTAADFGVPAESAEHDHSDHDHDDESVDADNDHDHEPGEADKEGVLIDHHGNRIVDELYQKYVGEGITLEFTAENFLGVGGRGGEVSADIRAGERALVKFKLSDAETGEPITGVQPLAWIDRLPVVEMDLAAGDGGCQDKVEAYLSGALTARPTLDLNSFFILALNDDPSISVIDPTVDVSGMTQLFALIQLTGRGEDWAVNADQQELWVTVPGKNQVAVAELDAFTMAKHLDGGPNPQRIAFQPDQRYLWIGNDAENVRESGVTVIDSEKRQIVAQIATGAGHHEIAFSPDSRYAYVTNSGNGRLVIIDTDSLQVTDDVRVGQAPAAIAVDESNGTLYVGDRGSGDILVLDGQDFSEITRMDTEAGLVDIGLTPDGRWGIATNPEAGKVFIFDTSTHTVTHVAEIDGAPDQISFSPDMAYVRVSGAPQVLTIPLAEIDPAAALSLNIVPVGEQAPGLFPSQALAGAVLPVAEQGAALVANPADDKVYYYPEGATATSGSFQGHTLFPRAVGIVDRSIREEAPGVYSGRVRIPEEGDYLVAVMLTEPGLVHCFEFTAKPDVAKQAIELPELIYLTDNMNPVAGQPFTVRLQLTNNENREGIDGLEDVFAFANQVAGNWNTRAVATSAGDGIYEVTLTVPQAGLYTVYVAVPSQGLNVDQYPALNLRVGAGT